MQRLVTTMVLIAVRLTTARAFSPFVRHVARTHFLQRLPDQQMVCHFSSAMSSEADRAYHVPVMLEECMTYLNIRPGGVYVDGTMGGGGHSLEILRRGGKVIALDQDPDAIAQSTSLMQSYLDSGQLEIHQVNFRNMLQVIKQQSKLADKDGVDGVLLDLGVSSHQIDEPSRGFSFGGDGPLQMRMDKSENVLDAATVVNSWQESDIADVLFQFGEERRSRRIARAIVEERPLHSTGELQRVIGKVTPFADRPKTFARCFQALRILVNDELGALDSALANMKYCIRPGGRLVVMSYHSLEDRRVKHYLRPPADEEGHRPSPEADEQWCLVTKKAVIATDKEVERNRRARSAKLRCGERVKAEVSAGESLPKLSFKEKRRLQRLKTEDGRTENQ